ncbi:rod shape-determining protein [Dactylosporangium sp. NBC_01737]|uniref:rod shape-determining protein n=1 Tax=Dactylosporangium sp. NBC_01737 TaxID=2975959 RepID=UPI002E104580|nr:rod shape-determining protein [Dactylosporangium sp. NBC_01737]
MASHHVARPAAAAVDFGSGCVRLWTSGGGNLSGPAASGRDTSAPLVRHGRVLDEPGCVALLSRLIGELDEPVPAGGVVVACRPVLSTPAEQQALRRVLTEVLAPSRLLLIDTVRAAAIGAGAAAGGLLVVDVGAQLTEVALLEHGRVVAARRTDLGTRDLGRGAGATVVAEAVTRMIGQLRGVPAAQPLLSAATRRGAARRRRRDATGTDRAAGDAAAHAGALRGVATPRGGQRRRCRRRRGAAPSRRRVTNVA